MRRTSWNSPSIGTVGLVLALLAGATLRLVWVDDIEYKGDESYVYHLARNPDKVEALNRMPPVKAAREIGN